MLTTSVVGGVCEKIESSFDWRIPNWKSCKKEQLHLWQSPSFQFSSATWKLNICFFADGQIWFSVMRMKNVQTRQVVEFKLIARKCDGTKYKIDEDEFEFTDKFNESHTLFMRGNLLTNETSFDDNIIISCTLSGNCSTANEAAQSMSSKSEDGGIKETEVSEDQVKPAKRGTKDFEKLSQNLKDLLVTGLGRDVTMKVDGREFPAHKLILIARSSVFEKMFSHDMEEKKGGVVDIRDCTPDAFKEFLCYLYSGELGEFSRDTVFNLYLLSDKYDVQELKSASVNFIAEDLCMDNFCDAVHLALQHSESILPEKAIKFFGKNLKKIIVSSKWQSFITENPIEANELYIKALNDLLPE